MHDDLRGGYLSAPWTVSGAANINGCRTERNAVARISVSPKVAGWVRSDAYGASLRTEDDTAKAFSARPFEEASVEPIWRGAMWRHQPDEHG
ncbi:MAG: hypothetical protein ACLSHC_14860 [Bilophila wadsworthia]